MLLLATGEGQQSHASETFKHMGGKWRNIHWTRLQLAQIKDHDFTRGSGGTGKSSHDPLKLILLSAFDLGTSNVLDKIYGLYAILQPGGLALVDPDYTLEPCIVFENVVRAWIEARGSLNILQIAARPTEFASDFPSWVPPWHLEYESNPYRRPAGIRKEGYVSFSCGMNNFIDDIETPRLVSIPSSAPGKLILRGQYLGKLDLSKSYSVPPQESAEKVNWKIKVEVLRDWCIHNDSLHLDNKVEQMMNTISFGGAELVEDADGKAFDKLDVDTLFGPVGVWNEVGHRRPWCLPE